MMRLRPISLTKRGNDAANPRAKVNARTLKPHPLVALLPSQTIEQLLATPALAEYPKGTVVFRAGDPSEAIFLILSGRCEARSSSGRDIVHEVFGPGDVLGERAFLNGEAHATTVIVTTTCMLLRIDNRDLNLLFEKDPEMAGRFARTIANRLRRLQTPHGASTSRVRRVVSFYSLAPRANYGVIMRALAVALRRVSEQRVLVVRLTTRRDQANLAQWPAMERTINGSFCFQEHLREQEGGFDELPLGIAPDGSSVAAIAPLLSHCSQHYDFVVLHVGTDAPAHAVAECVVQADIAFVLLQTGMQSLYDFDLLTRELDGRGSGHDTNVKPILLIDDDMTTRSAEEMLRDRGHPVHMFLRDYPALGQSETFGRRFEIGVARLAREISRRRVGIALSSGGAKGLAHIGVIQVLEENGIEVDAIAGASMGAYVGAIWAYGLDGAALEKIAREHESRWGLWGLVDPVLPPRQGFMRTRRVVRRLRRSIGTSQFADLVRPLRVVATHLDTLERVVFSRGDVAEAVAASIAIPGVVVPVTVNGETFIDGGIADPLPVDVLEEMGIEKIIAVNVIPPPEKLRQWLDCEKEGSGRAARAQRLRNALSSRINYFAHGNILDTMLQAVSGAQTRVAEASARRADVLLRPIACDAIWHDFTNPSKYIALGRRAAEAQLPALKALASPNGSHASSSVPTVAANAA
jgi:NTE family protein